MTNLLELENFGVAFAGRVVLSEVNFTLPLTGLTTVMGPTGGGKSTLIRTIAGLNDSHPSLTTWGRAEILGRPLNQGSPTEPGQVRQGVAIMLQGARHALSTVRSSLIDAIPGRSMLDVRVQSELVRRAIVDAGYSDLLSSLDQPVATLSSGSQRRVTLLRALLAHPTVLIADEPTARLDDVELAAILATLRRESAHRSVLVVTHRQTHAQQLGGRVVLLAGGKVVAGGEAATFFSSPPNAFAEQFVRTGGLSLPSPDAAGETLSAEVDPPEVPSAADARWAYRGPRGFFWALPGKLGGMPRPGIVEPLAHDLARLASLGVNVLVSLEESRAPELPEACATVGIESRHFPVPDMGAPGVEDCRAHCTIIEQLLRSGAVVAYHCRAGLGRTGLLLACHFVTRGSTANDAVERVRRLSPRAVQSATQLGFLAAFARRMPAVA